MAQPQWYSPNPMAVAANGQAVMVWTQVTGPTAFTSAVWASRNTDVNWSTPAQLSGVNSNIGSMRVAADGNAIAVWQDTANAREVVFASRLNASSGAWSVAQVLNDGKKNAFQPQLGGDAAANMLTIWYESSDAGQANGVVDVRIVASRFVVTGNTWTTAAAVQSAGAPAGQLPTVAVDAAGDAIAVWLQATPGNGTHFELWSAPFAAPSAAWGRL